MTKETLLNKYENKGYGTRDEAEAILTILESVKTSFPIVEIGVFAGKTTQIMGEYLQILGKPNKVIAIDPFIYVSQEEVQSYQPSNVRLVKGHSYTPSVYEGLKDIAVLFIDGDHDETSVTQDLEIWLPKVREACLLHDYLSSEPTHQVKQATEKLGLKVANLAGSLGLIKVKDA